MENPNIAVYRRALDRERAARKAAESILEVKSRELYKQSVELQQSHDALENRFKEADSELQGVFENIVDAYVVMDLNGNVLRMNKAAERMMGFNVNNAVNLIKLVHPDYISHCKEGFRTLYFSSSLTDFKTEIVLCDGSSKLVHVNASIIYNSKKEAVAAQGIIRDITVQDKIDRELIESQSRLSTLVLNMENGVLLENQAREIVLTNNKFCDLFSISATPDQLVGQDCSMAVQQTMHLFENPVGFLNRITYLISSKKQVLGDVVTMLDGRILERDFVPIWDEGVYKGHLWSYRDITLRNRFRESIDAERQKYSSIIANMNLGLMEVNLEDEILLVNQSLEKMSGYTASEMLGKKGNDFLLLEEEKQIGAQEELKRQRGLSSSYELRIHRKDDSLRHWLVSGAPQYNLKKERTGSIGIFLDITEFKNLEQQREQLFKKLKKSNDELKEYAHVVSHDLKSPLRSINALVQWIKEDAYDKLTGESLTHMNLIEETLDKMERIITDVLHYSSIEIVDDKREQTDLNDVIEDLKLLLHNPNNIAIEQLNTFPIMAVDKLKMQQLFQNLLSNALAYCDKEHGLITLDVEENKRYYTFFVKDNGIGIALEYHDKIFKIFQTLGNKKESTGIGLAIVKKIVDFYEGDIWLESELGKGSTFCFTLPK